MWNLLAAGRSWFWWGMQSCVAHSSDDYNGPSRESKIFGASTEKFWAGDEAGVLTFPFRPRADGLFR